MLLCDIQQLLFILNPGTLNKPAFLFQQGVYTEYKHPFAVAYLATSLFVVHLPIAFIKDWLIGILMRCYSCKNEDGADQNVDEESAAELDASAKPNGLHGAFEIESQEPLGNDCSCTYIYSDNVKLLVSESTNKMDIVIKEDKNITTREIAKFAFYVAPLWFMTEVRPDRIMYCFYNIFFEPVFR